MILMQSRSDIGGLLSSERTSIAGSSALVGGGFVKEVGSFLFCSICGAEGSPAAAGESSSLHPRPPSAFGGGASGEVVKRVGRGLFFEALGSSTLQVSTRPLTVEVLPAAGGE